MCRWVCSRGGRRELVGLTDLSVLPIDLLPQKENKELNRLLLQVQEENLDLQRRLTASELMSSSVADDLLNGAIVDETFSEPKSQRRKSRVDSKTNNAKRKSKRKAIGSARNAKPAAAPSQKSATRSQKDAEKVGAAKTSAAESATPARQKRSPRASPRARVTPRGKDAATQTKSMKPKFNVQSEDRIPATVLGLVKSLLHSSPQSDDGTSLAVADVVSESTMWGSDWCANS